MDADKNILSQILMVVFVDSLLVVIYFGDTVIDFITISTQGDASDFGDLTLARGNGHGFASRTRGLLLVDSTQLQITNRIDLRNNGINRGCN